MLPMLLRLRVKSRDASFGFFFPMLLLYILILPIYLIVAVVYLFMMFAPDQSEAVRRYMTIFFRTPQLLSAARGIQIKVQSKDADVIMFLI